MPERTERRKIIGILSAIGTNVNCVIGLGIFTAPGVVWKTLNAPLAMILWTLGGIISIAASLSYAVLGASIKKSGGEIEYFMHLGKVISYLFSFIIIIVIQPGTITSELQFAVQYLLYTVSNNPSEINFNTWEQGWSTLRLKLISIIILAIITGYHIPSSRVANFINVTFAGIKLVILVIIAIVGLVKLPSVLKEHPNIWSNPFDDTKEFRHFLFAFSLVTFSYDGWNNLNYLLANVAFISVVPKELVFKNNKITVSYFFKELLGEKAGQISSFIITISAIGTASSWIFSGSRVIARAADLDYIPFFSDKLKWESKDKSPKNALIAQFMWCSLLIILVRDEVSSDFYWNFSRLGALVMYALTGGVLLYLRYKKDFQLCRKYYYFLNILIWLFAVASIFVLILSIYLFFDIICPEIVSNCEEYRKNERIKRGAPYYIGLGYLIIGAICYYRLRKDDDDDDDDDDNDNNNDDDDDNDDDMNRKLFKIL